MPDAILTLPHLLKVADKTVYIADLFRGQYRPPRYERVTLPRTVLRRFDCVLAPTKARVVAEYERMKGGKLSGDALDTKLNKVAGQRFHNHSGFDFARLSWLREYRDQHHRGPDNATLQRKRAR